MRSTAVVITIIAFCVLTLVMVITIVSIREHTLPLAQIRFEQVWQCVGLLVATISAVALLISAVGGAGFEKLVPVTLPLLGGLLIAHHHWSMSVALGAIVLGVIFKDCCSRGRGGPPAI
jgi:hypothetical protein